MSNSTVAAEKLAFKESMFMIMPFLESQLKSSRHGSMVTTKRHPLAITIRGTAQVRIHNFFEKREVSETLAFTAENATPKKTYQGL